VTPRNPAPELAGAGGWIGPERPLVLSRLRGKVVLVHFWSASSVECQRLVEDLRPVEDLFADELVVVGVHAARFPAEADHGAVVDAVAALAIGHPVLDDADLSVWEAYGARLWPTVVLIGPTGEVAGSLEGEGCGEVLEAAVREVLEHHVAAGGRVRRRLVAVDRVRAPDGPLAFPGKVACSPDGRLLAVADTGHDRVLVCSLDGVVLEAHTGFLRPQGVRFDTAGVVVCDTLADRVVRTDGEVLADAIVSPWDLVHDGRSWVVAEAGGHRLVRVRPGELSTRLVAGTGADGSADGPVEKAVLSQPSGVAVTGPGRIAFVDAGASALRTVAEERRGGTVTTLVGDRRLRCGDADGPGDVARLQFPLGVAADPGLADGPVYVADTYNDAIRVWEGGRLRTLAVAGLKRPGGLDLLPDGRLVVADTGNHRIVVVDPATGSLTAVEVDETWVHGTDGPAVRVGAGRRAPVEVSIALVDEALAGGSGGEPDVEVTVSSRPGGLLAGGRLRAALPGPAGTVEVTGGRPGTGLLLVEVTARTRGAAGPARRVQRRRHVLEVTATAP